MRSAKKFTLLALAAITLSGALTSCATVFGGHVSAYQKRKPLPGEEQRQVRVGALVADVLLFWPGAVVDFATGAIYKPQRSATAQQTPLRSASTGQANRK